MKYSIIIIIFIIALPSCDMRDREEALQKKEALLNEKEQQLLLKERTLQLKEEELSKKEKFADSLAVVDTIAKYNPVLAGTWDVKMTCTETNCSGSAVGDTKSETWDISYQNKNVIAKAKVSDDLVRVYSGIYTGNTLELSEMLDSHSPPNRKMIIRLQIKTDEQMSGQREIERTDEKCRIVYALEMTKTKV